MGSLERRYAEALLSLTESAKQADGLGALMADVKRLVGESAVLREFLMNPALPASVRAEALYEIVNTDAGGADALPLLRRFLGLLLAKGRLALLGAIAGEYDAQKAAGRDVLRVTLRSSEPLDGETLARFREKYRAKYGARAAEITNTVEPGLLGGVCVQIGDTRIDDTLNGRLASLSRGFTDGGWDSLERGG